MDHDRYRQQIATALAAGPNATTSFFIVAVSTLAGEHRFGGDFGVRLRKLHDFFCGSDSERADFVRELKDLAKVPKKELEKSAEEEPIHRTFGPLTPALVSAHCSMCEDPVPDAPDEGNYWTALYGPSYLLGWTELVGAERDLLTLPMTVPAKLDAAALRKKANAAIERARYAYPALVLDAANLDYRSATHFAWSLSQALVENADGFDRSKPVPAKGKGKKPKKVVAPPDMKPMENLLVERTRKALTAWVKANPKAELALLGFDGTPPHDNVGICFGSEDGLQKTISHLAPDATAARKALDYRHWELARPGAGWLERFDVSHADGHYAAEVKLPKYAKYAGSDDAPTSKRPDGITWGDGALRVLFARALQRVVDSGDLGKVRCAPTLYLVYTMHDETPVVVHSVARA